MLKPEQCRMARAALDWSLSELQKMTGINKNTIVRFEAGKGILFSTAERLEHAFAKEGLTFIYENETRGAGIQLSRELSTRLAAERDPIPKRKSTKRSQKSPRK